MPALSHQRGSFPEAWADIPLSHSPELSPRVHLQTNPCQKVRGQNLGTLPPDQNQDSVSREESENGHWVENQGYLPVTTHVC